MVGNVIWILLEIYLSFQQWKSFENPLRIDKVIAMSLVYYFLGHIKLLQAFSAISNHNRCSMICKVANTCVAQRCFCRPVWSKHLNVRRRSHERSRGDWTIALSVQPCAPHRPTGHTTNYAWLMVLVSTDGVSRQLSSHALLSTVHVFLMQTRRLPPTTPKNDARR